MSDLEISGCGPSSSAEAYRLIHASLGAYVTACLDDGDHESAMRYANQMAAMEKRNQVPREQS